MKLNVARFAAGCVALCCACGTWGAVGMAPSTLAMCLFSRNGGATPRSSTYNAGAWGPGTALSAALPSEGTFFRCAGCPVRSELMCVALDDANAVSVLTYSGSAWAATTKLCADAGVNNYRACDAAYEQLSGNALIVYWKSASTRFAYRTWNGSSVSGETLLPAVAGGISAKWVTLCTRPSSNEIVLLAQTKNGASSLSANTWNGSAWGGWTTLTSSLTTDAKECFAMAFETLSGKAVAVYSESGQKQPRYRTYNGGAWSGQSLMASLGNVPQWFRLASDPTSNTILLAGLDGGSDLEVNNWDGSAWGTDTQLESDTGGNAERRFDLAFEKGTSKAVIVYREKNKNMPQYRSWNGASWGAETTGPNLNRKCVWFQAAPGAASGEVQVAIADDQNTLHLMTWAASAMSGATAIESNLGVSSGAAEPFCLVTSPVSIAPVIKSWAEAQPN